MQPPFKACNKEKPYLFVSYAHADKAVVYPEIQWLHKLRYRIWYDEGINLAARFFDTIATAIKGCDYFIIFVTPRAVQSTFVNEELHYARINHKPILAVHLEKTELPSGMGMILEPRQALFKHEESSDRYRQKLQDGIPGKLRETGIVKDPPEKEDVTVGTDPGSLIQAVIDNKMGTVKDLVAAGADLEATDKSGRTALMLASRSNNLEMVIYLCDKGADVNARSSRGNSSLMLAAASNRVMIVHQLLDRRANVNAKNLKGETALMLAAERGHSAIVKLLKARGAKEE